MGFKMVGLEDANKGFNILKREMETAAGDTVKDGTDVLYDQSQIQVPVDTTALKNSGRRIYHSQTGPKRSMGIKYGFSGEGPNIIDYAAAVHEIIKASHVSPTKAKYVEDPLVQNIGEYKSISAMACKKAVGRSF